MRRLGASSKAPQSNEMVAEVIAGPETAARLGVPVGTVVEARHVLTSVDGSTTRKRSVVSPEKAARIRRRILGQKEE